MVRKKEILPGKIYPFNVNVFNKLDADDKVNYMQSHSLKSKKRKKNY